ncbi:hypothetical protein HY638_03170 [Candidatus Woesearchaeota archaeon]|nr:hypothetical protein [Candidatus Woesearchaeota archaeon]
MKSKLCIPIIFLALFSIAVSASFEASAQSASIGVCQCSSQSDAITITNTGVFGESFTITETGSAAVYVTTIPETFELEPGKSRQVYRYFNTPCDFSGALELKTAIAAASGEAKEFVQQVNAGICSNIDAITGDYSRTVCPCTPASYNITLANTGFGMETYFIGVNRLSEYTGLTENPVNLNAGQSRVIVATVNPPCEVFGRYELDFTITAAQSNVVATVPVNLNIEPCYGFDVSFGNPVSEDIQPSSVPFVPHTGPYRMCNGEKSAIPFLIKNNAEVSNLFNVKVNSPLASIPASQVYLEPKQEGIMLMQYRPSLSTVGNFTFTVDITSARGLITKTYQVNVESDFCYDANLVMEEENVACCYITTELPLKIENRGSKTADFRISLDAPDYVRVKDDSPRIAAGNSSNATLEIFPQCEKAGEGSLFVNISADGKTDALDYGETELTLVPKDKCFPLEIGSASSVIVDYTQNIIPVSIKNTGSREATYSVSVDQDFANIVDEITLRPGQKEVVGLVTEIGSEIAEGSYPVKVSFSSGDLVYSKDITIKLQENKGFFGSLNNWVRYYSYYLMAGFGVLILSLICLFAYWTLVWRKKRKIKELKKAGLYIEEKKEAKKEVKKKKKPQFNWKIAGIAALAVIILAGASFSVYYFGLLSPIKDFFSIYGYYIIGGIAILAVIIGIIHFKDSAVKLFRKK